jgi:hypothetical protein
MIGFCFIVHHSSFSASKLADFFNIRYPSLSCTAKGSQEKMPSK